MVKVHNCCVESVVDVCEHLCFARKPLNKHSDLHLQKSAGTLPVRKHKFNPTPVPGQAITKFFDRKKEEVTKFSMFITTTVASLPHTVCQGLP